MTWSVLYLIPPSYLDNPGFTLTVDLDETELLCRSFQSVQIQRANEHDWIHCIIEGQKFKGACGPQNLDEMLVIFLNWAELF